MHVNVPVPLPGARSGHGHGQVHVQGRLRRVVAFAAALPRARRARGCGARARPPARRDRAERERELAPEALRGRQQVDEPPLGRPGGERHQPGREEHLPELPDHAGPPEAAVAAPPGEREALVRGVLTRTVRTTGYLDEAQEAVAAAALIAAQCPGGGPVETVYGPEQPLPVFPEDLRELAARALDRILADDPGLEMWVGPADAPQWLAAVAALRDVLGPRPPSPDVPLPDL